MPARHKRKKLYVILILIVFCLTAYWVLVLKDKGTQTNTSQTETFNKQQYSLTEPTSLWVIVNKQRVLQASYVPQPLKAPAVPLRTKASDPEMKLQTDAASAVEKLVGDAQKQGHNVLFVSGYRSYISQRSIYNNFVKQDGQAEADRTSARPGHSEHQTGLAADFGTVDRNCELEECFGATKAGQWLAANASSYGFVLRYPNGKESIVGYSYEPWHFRYVGEELAKQVQKSGQTLEEFFGLPAAPTY